MTIGVHVARVGVFNVNSLGVVVKKDDPSVTISDVLATTLEHRIIADDLIPNSATNPTVKSYLELESADDYVLEYLDQNTVVTYKRTSTGGFTT